ncbi:hypothetical protein GCM10023324_46640 [Streptomyces youssoufiensis]
MAPTTPSRSARPDRPPAPWLLALRLLAGRCLPPPDVDPAPGLTGPHPGPSASPGIAPSRRLVLCAADGGLVGRGSGGAGDAATTAKVAAAREGRDRAEGAAATGEGRGRAALRTMRWLVAGAFAPFRFLLVRALWDVSTGPGGGGVATLGGARRVREVYGLRVEDRKRVRHFSQRCVEFPSFRSDGRDVPHQQC